MKFALVNGQRQEARPNLSGKCPNPNCDRPMVAKCGEVKIWHWAHQGSRPCGDPGWENETEWHLKWKGGISRCLGSKFVHRADDGYQAHCRHQDRAWVGNRIPTFKHQPRRAAGLAIAFYRQLCFGLWTEQDGKRDAAQFARAWSDGTPVGKVYPAQRLSADECALLREWSGSLAPIFFDFGDGQVLWWLLPGRLNGSAYVAQFPRNVFIHIHRSGVVQEGLDFNGLVKEFSGLVARYEANLRLRR